MIPVLPFILELFADYLLIRGKRKDLALWLRVILIGLCSTETLWTLTIPPSNLCLAVAPFFFFDNLLAWMRGKRGFDYEGKTKAYDKWLTRFNPYALMVLRFIGFGLSVAGYVVLRNNGL
jgi:hypothetical protein